MKISLKIILLTLCFSLGSCSFLFDQETPLEKERKELQEELESLTPSFWKAIKIIVRATPIPSGQENMDISQLEGSDETKDLAEAQKLLKLVQSIFMKMNRMETEDSQLSAAEYVQLVMELVTLKKTLKHMEEDDYPTILENFSASKQETLPDFYGTPWNSSLEHCLVAVLLEGVKQVPASFQLYEYSKVKYADLPQDEIIPLSMMLQGIAYMENGWNYLAEESFTFSIDAVNSGNLKVELLQTQPIWPGLKIETEEDYLRELNMFSKLLRAFARFGMDDEEKKELAIQDLQGFLEDAEALGLDNELTWLGNAGVSIYYEDSEKAVKYLTKLEQSPNIPQDAKEYIIEIKEYMADRKKDKALNMVFDRVFMLKIVLKLVWQIISEIDWDEKIRSTESGAALMEFFDHVKAEYQNLKKYADPDKVDDGIDKMKEKGEEWKGKGKEWIKEVTQ